LTPRQRVYNSKFYIKKQMRRIDNQVRDIQAAAIAGTRKTTLIEVKMLAKRVYALGTKIERTTLKAVKCGAAQRTIDDLRDLATMMEYYSDTLYDNAKKLWYTDAIPHFPLFKTVLDPVSDLQEQATAIREMDLVLEGKD